MMTTDGKKMRLQVPVSQRVADRISELAAELRRSQRWMARELLVVVVENRQSLLSHLTSQVFKWIEQASDAIVDAVVPPPADAKSTVYLDLEIDAKTAAFIHTLADKLKHTPAKMAGVMLEWGVLESAFAIELLVGPMLAARDGIKALANAVGNNTQKQCA